MEDKLVTCRLSDGREVLVRRPTVERDLDRLQEFFEKLPAAVKNHLRYDVGKDRATGEVRLRQIDGIDHLRLVAELQDGTFIADGTMDREPFGWTRHIASMRIVVDPNFESLGAREAVCEELVRLAQQAGIERLETDVLPEHSSYLRFLETLGFAREVVRKNHAKGIDGKLHDLIIMSNDLETVWRHLQDTIVEMDLSFARWAGGH
jgi:RimJ/RimL family protein N-acetyltransferase